MPLEIQEYAHAAGRELAHQRGPFAHVQHGADLGPAQAGKPGRELKRLAPAREVERDDELSHGPAPAPRAPGRADRRGRRVRAPRATRRPTDSSARVAPTSSPPALVLGQDGLISNAVITARSVSPAITRS